VSFLSRIFRFESRKSDLDAELRSHLEMAVADRIAAGESPEEARAAAQRELGNLPLIEDVTRAAWGWLWLESILQDVAYALRQFRRSPGFAASVIGTLALGIAAATAMFTVVDHVLLRPLPFRDADRLVAIEPSKGSSQSHAGVPWLDIAQWQAQSHTVEQFALYGQFILAGRNFIQGYSDTFQVNGIFVSANLFNTLGVHPAIGRDFIAEPVTSTAGKNTGAVILSDSVWKAALGADPRIVGKSVTISNKSFTVVGVMPPGFDFPDDKSPMKIWTPVVLDQHDAVRDYMSPRFSVVARLRPGVSIQTAGSEISTIQKPLAKYYIDERVRREHSDVLVSQYADTLVAADLRKALLALLAASGVLWLIAAVNATNLILARSAARQREIAMRGALGASRWRIVQQFLIEGLMLSSAATLLGTALALTAVRLSRSVVPERLHVDLAIQINPIILAVLCVLTLITALLSSAWPAILAVGAPIEPTLRQSGLQAGTGTRHKRIRSILVAVEVAMSLTLLMSCGLLLRTIYTLRHVPLGYRTDHIVVANLSIPTYRYTGQNMVVNLYQPLLERVKQMNGVQAAGLMSQVPLGKTFNINITMATDNRSIVAKLKPVTSDIQRIFGFSMLAGRFFNDSDTVTSQPVVVVNRAFAEFHSPNRRDPSAIIGKELFNLRKDSSKTVIIGVLDDQRQGSIAEPSQPEVELCLNQLTPASGMYQPTTIAMDLVVRSDRPLASVIPELRTVLRQASPELANATLTTMDQVVEDSFGSQRLAAHLLEFFAGSALLLSVAGLYGLLAWIVAQRTREMGVRIALGARRGNLLWLVLRQAGIMLLAGIVAGGALAWFSARLLTGYLYGVSAHDGWTIAAAALLLFSSGILAAWLPAHRAARVDPMLALRAE
jgi:predicted permease